MQSISEILAQELNCKQEYIENVIALLDEGNTIPFIARYRKELHGAMDDTTLRTLSERGVLPSRNSDIYATFTAAMIDPLPEKQREFLAVMGLADEFTVEMAQCITGDADAAQILAMGQQGMIAHGHLRSAIATGPPYRGLSCLA